MAVMVNSMGDGTELRGPIYAKEFKTDVTDELTEVVNLAGPGRLLYAMVTRMQSGSGNSYSATMDNIFVKIIPDGDDTKTLKKTHGGDNCNSNSHLAVRPLMQTLNFPEIKHDGNLNSTTALDYTGLKPETVPCTSTRVLHSSRGYEWTFSGSAEGISDSAVDTSVTLYPDGIFFDDSLIIQGRWGRTATRDFNGVILVYQIFD